MPHAPLEQILEKADDKRATDIHICAGAPVLFRINGDLTPYGTDILSSEEAKRLAYTYLSEKQKEVFEKNCELDFMWFGDRGRYRINLGYFSGQVGSVIRILPHKPRSLRELNLPDVVSYLSGMTKGLILITGSTSQGKTTTLSAIIDHINHTRRKHIITLEDPIEYVHTNRLSVVRQREIGSDTHSFNKGLRAGLRQDPDVIAIGEMRDYDTIRIALTAGETGVLVLSTLHIISIDKILERLLSYAPPEEEGHFRYLLADCLQGIIHQELLPTLDGGKQVACEVLVMTDAARNIIRRRGTYMLRDVITTGKRHGMFTMADSVKGLLSEGVISKETAEGVMAHYRV